MAEAPYFLPDGYVSRGECVKTGFWTPQRIAREPFNGSYNVLAWVTEREGGLAGSRLLDIGCGPASKLRKFFPRAEITGLDTPEAVALARANIPDGAFFACDLDDRASVGRVSARLGRFPCITCVDVIEHVLFPEHILALVRRHLAPGGTAYIATLERDLSRGPGGRLGSPKPEHVREWNRDEFRRFVASGGLDVAEVKITPQSIRPTENERPFRVQTLRCTLAADPGKED